MAQKKERGPLQSGHVYVQMGRYRDAIDSFQKTVELDPEAVEAYLQPGYLYLFLGAPPKALSMARTVPERRPDLEGGYLPRGNVYLKGKDLERARGRFESAMKLAQGSKLKLQGFTPCRGGERRGSGISWRPCG